MSDTATPNCPKCSAPMGEVYEMDVVVYANNQDTGDRDKHRGFLCRGCERVAWTKNGGVASHAKKSRALPKDAHPRMNEKFGEMLKAVKNL